MELNQAEELKSVNRRIKVDKELINQDALTGKFSANKVVSDQLPYVLKVLLLQRSVSQGLDT